MSHDIDRNCTIFIVETEDYSGNFERDMVAYMTGHVGQCGVGSKLADLARSEWAAVFEDDEDEDRDYEDDEAIFGLPVPLQFDGEGCSRPATIWPTEGWVNNGHGESVRSDKPGFEAYLSVAVAFENELAAGQIETLTKRARSFCENYVKLSNVPWATAPLKFTGIRVVRRVIVCTDTTIHVETV